MTKDKNIFWLNEPRLSIARAFPAYGQSWKTPSQPGEGCNGYPRLGKCLWNPVIISDLQKRGVRKEVGRDIPTPFDNPVLYCARMAGFSNPGREIHHVSGDGSFMKFAIFNRYVSGCRLIPRRISRSLLMMGFGSGYK
jgi:hypothetical protein